MKDKVILWYWRLGGLYFKICASSDWYADWYNMGENGECAKSHVEIGGKAINPDTIPEYRAWKYTQEKKEDAMYEKMRTRTSDFITVEVQSLLDGERVNWARYSIPEDKWQEYIDIFGEDRVRRAK